MSNIVPFTPGAPVGDWTSGERARLSELAGPGARILAPPVYWIGLKDHPYADIFVFERVERQYGMTAAQFLDEIKPDLVITDAKIATDRRVERLL